VGNYLTMQGDIAFSSRYESLTLPKECQRDFEFEKGCDWYRVRPAGAACGAKVDSKRRNWFMIRPADGEYCAEFNSYKFLLEWISSVIAYDDYAIVHFVGDAGESLEYRVFATFDIEKAAGHYNIFMVEYAPSIEGMLLDDFIEKYKEENWTKNEKVRSMRKYKNMSAKALLVYAVSNEAYLSAAQMYIIEEELISRKDALFIYNFACHCGSRAHIDKLEAALFDIRDLNVLYMFARDVEHANVGKIRTVLLDNGYIEYAEQLSKIGNIPTMQQRISALEDRVAFLTEQLNDAESKVKYYQSVLSVEKSLDSSVQRKK